MKLHEAILKAIDIMGNVSPNHVADYINKTQLYKKRDLSDVTPKQIRARIRQYPNILQIKNGLVYKTWNSPNITIQYDGMYPNLCRGHLEIWINETYYDFGENCLSSGGYVSFDEEWNAKVGDGEWSVEFPKNFPEEYKQTVLNKINQEIPHGCCGGCV